MAVENDFVEGLDPTGIVDISASQVLQVIREAQPQTNKMLIIVSESTPDVANNTRYTRYFWWKVSTKALKYYDTPNWTIVPVNDGAVGTAQLVAAAVTLAKIAYSEGSATQLLRINAAGNGVEWWTLAFANNSIAITKIAPGSLKTILTSDDTGAATLWRTADQVAGLLSAGVLPLSLLSLTGSATNKFLYFNSTALAWTLLDIGKLDTTGLTGNRYLGTNAGATAFEMKTAPTLVRVFNHTSGVTLVTTDVKTLTLTKPAGRTWAYLRVNFLVSATKMAGATSTIAIAFTWGTAPVDGTAVEITTGGGSGNTGMAMTSNNSDDSLKNLWYHEGIVHTSLVSTDIITLKATCTIVGGGTLTSPVWDFSLVGEYI